ncbi:hypothetical protein [Actinokineospora spheciospongiae]|uniref:hypothetical protein n=1 Tax=Actinokineospora spheciospongiae TaxID=909613 RepID=UPI001268C748|nr:hypothetical protein [Actinokineospora spheciospongiae]
MKSNALTVWREERSRRLDRLVAAHHRMLDAEAMDEWGADELSHAVLLRLAAEFQGFCRDLLDACVEVVFAAAGIADRGLENVFRSHNVLRGRRLDSGNATKDNIAIDFLRCGLEVWVELGTHFPHQVRGWISTVNLLNQARNGIAHDVEAKLNLLRRDGHSLSLATALEWRFSLDELAEAMDTVCSTYLRTLLPELVQW